MATFNDNFERANGALGGNWTANGANVQIVNGIVLNTTNANWAAYNSGVGGAGRQEARATVVGSPTSSYHAGVFVKGDTGLTAAYAAFVTYLTGTWTFRLRVGAIRGGTDLDTATTTTSPPGQYTVTIVWDDGALTATCPGFDTLTATDYSLVANGSLGINGVYNPHAVNSCTLIAGNQPALDVTPTIIGNYGTPTELTFVGTSTDWTSGTPGSPTFTCDHGTLSNQEITDTTHATADFDPGDFLGVVTFTDPSTGETDQITVTSDVGVVPPTGGMLPESILDYLQRSADAEVDSVIANRNMNIAASGPSITLTSGMNSIRLATNDTSVASYNIPTDTNLGEVLLKVWELLNDMTEPAVGVWEPASGMPLMQQLDVLRETWTTFRGPLAWTVPGILAAIQGGDDRDLSVIYDLIEAQGAGSNADVLSWLNTYLGTGGPTLLQLGTMVSDIATVAGYTLGDVLDAIAAVQGVDLSTITAKLNAIQPSETYNLSTITTQATGANTAAQAAVVALSAMTGDGALTLQSIIDAIEAITFPESATAGPPVWPGVANVTMGDTSPLVDQTYLVAAMDGVIVNITTPPTRTGRYVIGGATMDYGVGRLAFETDDGDLEPWQYLGFRTAIFTPKTMEHAAGVRFQVLAGAEGTVTPWTRS